MTQCLWHYSFTSPGIFYLPATESTQWKCGQQSCVHMPGFTEKQPHHHFKLSDKKDQLFPMSNHCASKGLRSWPALFYTLTCIQRLHLLARRWVHEWLPELVWHLSSSRCDMQCTSSTRPPTILHQTSHSHINVWHSDSRQIQMQVQWCCMKRKIK
jgi:hypothetical protein